MVGVFFMSLLGLVDMVVLLVFNSLYIVMLLIVFVGLFIGWWLYGCGEVCVWYVWMLEIGVVVVVWGLLWWVSGGLYEIFVYVSCYVDLYVDCFVVDMIVLFVVGIVWFVYVVCCWFVWLFVEWFVFVFMLVLVLFVLCVFDVYEVLLLGMGVFVWLIVVGVGFVLLWC